MRTNFLFLKSVPVYILLKFSVVFNTKINIVLFVYCLLISKKLTCIELSDQDSHSPPASSVWKKTVRFSTENEIITNSTYVDDGIPNGKLFNQFNI